MHWKRVPVGKYTSTSEHFSCQVQKGAALFHYTYSLTCSHQEHLLRKQKLNAMDPGVTNSFAIPPSPHRVMSSQLRRVEVCMKSAHREVNSRAELGKAQVMLKGKEKHFEEFTVIFLSKTGKSPIKLLETVLCVKGYFLPISQTQSPVFRLPLT